VRILLEAHHPAHIHFWKYPVRELVQQGHDVLLIGRDRDVMRRLLEVYDWIPSTIPKRPSERNRFPLSEMFSRQLVLAKEIRRFKPTVVASSMGSYCQSARILGCWNIIFTDTETQAFNHRISHPFAHEIHTPRAYLKELGPKQRKYNGIHELCYLDGRHFQPNAALVAETYGMEKSKSVLIRLSAWNTLHDRKRCGVGDEVFRFVDHFKDRFRIVISAEENKVPARLKRYATTFAPEDFHDILGNARFVLTEGASTSSEAACLGVPSVFVNSTEPLGVPLLLEREYGLVRSFQVGRTGVSEAIGWLDEIEQVGENFSMDNRCRMRDENENVCNYVVESLTAKVEG